MIKANALDNFFLFQVLPVRHKLYGMKITFARCAELRG